MKRGVPTGKPHHSGHISSCDNRTPVPSACSGDKLCDGEMLVVRTIEDTTNPIGKFVCSKKSIGLYNFSLAVHPHGLHGVQPRALLGQKTAHDPNPFAALFDPSVVFAEPSPHLFGDVPTGVVPDEKKDLLAKSFELLATTLKKRPRNRWPTPDRRQRSPSAGRAAFFFRIGGRGR